MRKAVFFFAVCMLMFSAYSFASFVYAHDNKYKKNDHEEHEFEDEYEQYEDDGYKKRHFEREDDRYEGVKDVKETMVRKEYWYKWSRYPEMLSEYENTPINNRQTITIAMSAKNPIHVVAVPMKGQIFVPLEETAKYIGASVTVYSRSQIAEIQFSEHHLIVKNGTRVAYEMMKKKNANASPFIFGRWRNVHSN
ncbi:copper amine oxidase N-terminal domain-containing protein [Anoxybacillus sp. KU2-6(11)]|uniref:copper amine oxidase N-terminal domain-containing protein n=1 Tax=Anoxybacillus sp. KU2-6(11) TaxID=1535751 RepID=UPI000AA29F83|nr:copper amine oxidase N-terminal domain-containing protein [Anoxybacillus sp. KU2-6(11)]